MPSTTSSASIKRKHKREATWSPKGCPPWRETAVSIQTRGAQGYCGTTEEASDGAVVLHELIYYYYYYYYYMHLCSHVLPVSSLSPSLLSSLFFLRSLAYEEQ